MYGYTFDDCYHRSIGCSIEHYGGPVVNVGGVTEALALHRPPVVTSPSILAHGSMPWESRTMMVVAVQGAPRWHHTYPRRCRPIRCRLPTRGTSSTCSGVAASDSCTLTMRMKHGFSASEKCTGIYCCVNLLQSELNIIVVC